MPIRCRPLFLSALYVIAIVSSPAGGIGEESFVGRAVGSGMSARNIQGLRAALVFAWRVTFRGKEPWPELQEFIKSVDPEGAQEGKGSPSSFFEKVRSWFRSAAAATDQPYANVYGDPEVCCVWSASKMKFEKMDVFGPFSTVCLNDNGTVAAIEFIGLCDSDGSRCQARDAYYVGEVWHFNFASGTFKHKNLKTTIGGNNRHNFCEPDWATRTNARDLPSDKWMQPFKNGRSFFVWQKDPHAAIEGPSGEFLTKMFSEDASVEMAKLITEHARHLTDDITYLLQSSLSLLAVDTTGGNQHERQEIATYVLVTSLLLSMKSLV